MQFAFSEEQQWLAESARKFLDGVSSSEDVRALMESEAGYDPDVWRRVAGELGWTALILPEKYGGFGFGWVELVAVLEEAGRALFCSPLFSTVCLGATCLLEAGSEAQRTEILPGVATGETLVTLALAEPGRPPGSAWNPENVETRAVRHGSGWRLTGKKTRVVDGHLAKWIIVVARTSDAGAIRAFLVNPDSAGATLSARGTVDTTRKCCDLVLESVDVDDDARLPGDETAIRRALDLAVIGLSAEAVGGADRCLELSTDYAKIRRQFGRPIGSFQAIKHTCADMLVEVESARSALYYAGWVASEEPAELGIAASMAKARASEAYFRCASDCIQIHGGIGFTWEHDAHLYFKRARATAELLGDATWHLDRIATDLGWREVAP